MVEIVVDALKTFLRDVTVVITTVANQPDFDSVRDDAVRTLFDLRFPLCIENLLVQLIKKNIYGNLSKNFFQLKICKVLFKFVFSEI